MRVSLANREMKRQGARTPDPATFFVRSPPCAQAFTLVELILVLALLVIATSQAVPALQNFVRGRALDSEARRMVALTHAAQSRAVSEGMPMVFWINIKTATYGLEAETSGDKGDAKAERFEVDSTLQLALADAGNIVTATFKNLPAIRFLPDGMVDESSPQVLKLTDAAGFSRWLKLAKLRTGYEISDSDK